MPDTATLHIFADASPQAYGAVAYLVQGTQSTILMSKARAAPLKQHTLPRLELMAAVLGARLYVFISTSINITDTFFWSDSQIVLSWITSKKTLKPFVSDHINEIRSVSTEWRYADLLTRGISFDQFNSSTQWRHGPTWLYAEILIVQADADEEVGTPAAITTEPPSVGLHHLIDLTRFSKLSKLLSVTAYLYRFIHNTRQFSSSQQTGPLTVSELTRANLKWIQDIQNSVFFKEIANIQSGRNRLPLVRQLKLFIDKDLLRCGGRIHNAPLSELAKFPYLLPALYDSCHSEYPYHSSSQWSKCNIDCIMAKLLGTFCPSMN